MEYDKIIEDTNTSTILLNKTQDRILKLFPTFTSESFVEKEFNNALTIKGLSFNKAEVHGRNNIQGRFGIVYEYIKGDKLTNLIQFEFEKNEGDEDLKNLEKYSFYLSDLHKKITKNKVPHSVSYKSSIRYQICASTMHTKEEKKEALQILERLPSGDSLCHGDYHVGNLIISGETPYIIDFADICKGPALFDIARCYCMTEHKYGFQDLRSKPKLFKRALKIRDIVAKKYLEQMNVSWDDIKDYYHLVYMCKTNYDRSISTKDRGYYS